MNAGITALLLGLVILFTAWAIFAPKKEPERDIIKEELFADIEASEVPTSFSKYIRPLLNNFLPQSPIKATSAKAQDSISQLIVRSGNPWKLRPEEFRGTQLLFALFGLVLGFFFVYLEVIPLPPVIIVLALAASGYMVPYGVYNSARQKRATEIKKQLPDALDLLVVTMNSGQNFEPSLSSITPSLPEGALKDEFSKIVAEISSGRSLESSLMAFANRAASDEVESFAKAVAQTQRLGADVSKTLASQAQAAREAYEAVLDKKIAKVSDKMMFALVPTMIPAIMIIFIAPSLTQLTNGLL